MTPIRGRRPGDSDSTSTRFPMRGIADASMTDAGTDVVA
jgi:hypothetical protein